MTILDQAETIRDETQAGENTAERVGTCLVDIANKLTEIDPRDMIPVFAQVAMNENSTPTPISVAGTYYKIEGTTVDVICSDVTTTQNGRVTVAVGGESYIRRYAVISGNISVSCDTGSHVIHMAVAKNGQIESSVISSTVTNNSPSKESGLSISLLSQIADGDYFELFITEKDHVESLLVTHMSLSITQVSNYIYGVV